MTAAMQQQVQALVEELGALKGEIVNLTNISENEDLSERQFGAHLSQIRPCAKVSSFSKKFFILSDSSIDLSNGVTKE